MQKRFLITFFLCFSTLLTFAQTNDGSFVDEGSAYSQFGIGVPVDYGSPAADGMGLVGVSYMEPAVASMANPAQWGSTVYGMATGGIGINTYRAEDNFGSAQNSLLYVDQFQLQLPIYKNKLGISASFSPYSRSAYQVAESGTKVVGDAGTEDNLEIESTNTGSGGVHRLELGFGWNINSNIAVGYAPSLVFVSIDNEFQTRVINTSPDPGTIYFPSTFTEQTSGSGFGHRFGTFFTFPSLLKEGDQLNLGATLSLPVDIDAERIQEDNRVSRKADEDEFDDLTLAEGSIKIPLGLTTGLTYKPSNKLALSTELLYQRWSDYENEVKNEDTGVFTDRLKLGAGISYFPFTTGSNKFLSGFKYRFGASYDSGYLQVDGENINTIMFSAGIGLLSPNSNSSVDLSFEYGFRGTKSQNLVKEDIWGFKLSLNLAEIFFFRPKLQ